MDQDHDLLIRLEEKVDNLIERVDLISKNVKAQVDDHETRLRFIEKYVWLALGALTVLQAIGYFNN